MASDGSWIFKVWSHKFQLGTKKENIKPSFLPLGFSSNVHALLMKNFSVGWLCQTEMSTDYKQVHQHDLTQERKAG